MKRRILVCGGREFTDQVAVNLALDQCLPFFDREFVIIEGGARGADRCAKVWAVTHGFPVIEMSANWEFYGKATAGPLRNWWMLKHAQPDLVVAFPGGTGTADMVKKARSVGVEVYKI